MKITSNKENTIIHANGVQISFPSAELFRHFNQAFLADMLNTVLERIGIEPEKANQLASDESFIERWLEAVANDETIKVCMEQLAAECVRAEEVKNQNDLPMFRVGDTATYTFHNGYPTSETELESRNGKSVTILRELTEDEYDKADVGPMYHVQFMDGFVADVFEDELSFAKPERNSAPAPHDFVKNLAQYNGGAVNGTQLRELCSYFTVMADLASLLSPDFRVFFRNAVIPKLWSEGMRLCLEAKTIDCISGLAATPSPLQDHANGAKELLIDLHNHDLLYTCHAAEDGPTVESSLNTDKALANFIRHRKDHPVCLFTNNPYLVNHLTEEVAPKCICFGFNKDNELFIHLSSIPKLAALCWPQEGGASA